MISSNDSGIRVAVVPARGGSKRIPRKNIVDFHGKPIIHWPLEMLVDSGLFEVIVVSTDDEEVAAVATEIDGVTIHERPRELAGDEVPTAPVIIDALAGCELSTDSLITEVAVMYPTSVFCRAADLAAARKRLANASVDLVMSVGRFRSPVQRAWRTSENDLIERVDPTAALLRTQDLEVCFFDAAQFYVSAPDAWIKMAAGAQVATAAHVLEDWQTIDIDTPDDLDTARVMFGARSVL